VLVNKLRKPERASHSSRSAANDHNISRHLRARYIGWRFAEGEHLQLVVF
jgi:hypothetical protein